MVYVIPVQGPIEPALVYVVRRGVQEAERMDAQAIVLDMDTPGGTLDAAREIVNLVGNIKVPTYTFVRQEAFSAGAIIALATRHIYMAPGSVIGDAMPILMGAFSGPQEMPEDLQEKMVSAVSALIRSAAEQGGHDKELAEAMVRRGNELVIDGEVICPEGELLTLTNQEAERRIGDPPRRLLSEGTVDEIPELLEQVGLGGAEIRRLEVTGTERLARLIKALAPLFLGAGLLGLYIEFKTPGIGLPGALGALCLAIFFWGHHVAGLAGAEELLIMLLGAVLLGVELFLLPGFGIAGISGLFLIFWGLLLTMVQHYPGGPAIPSWPQFRAPVMNLGIALLATLAGGTALGSVLPKTRLFRRLTLQEATSRDRGYVAAHERTDLVGRQGVALSALRPSGAVVIDDQRIDVVTRGEFVAAGSPVRVVEAHGGRIVVEPAPPPV